MWPPPRSRLASSRRSSEQAFSWQWLIRQELLGSISSMVQDSTRPALFKWSPTQLEGIDIASQRPRRTGCGIEQQRTLSADDDDLVASDRAVSSLAHGRRPLSCPSRHRLAKGATRLKTRRLRPAAASRVALRRDKRAAKSCAVRDLRPGQQPPGQSGQAP